MDLKSLWKTSFREKVILLNVFDHWRRDCILEGEEEGSMIEELVPTLGPSISRLHEKRREEKES